MNAAHENPAPAGAAQGGGRLVLITRPPAQAAATAALIRTARHRPLIAPLLDIVEEPASLGDLDVYQALLLTSANAVRCLAGKGVRRDLPAYTVGTATAQAARAAGFSAVHAAAGDGLGLASLVRRSLDPANGPLLHASGVHVAIDLAGLLGAEGFAVDRVVLYRAVARTSLPEDVVQALRERALDDVLFFSARTAAIFTDILNRFSLSEAVQGVRALCLSQAIADRAASDLSWRAVAVVALNDESALMAAMNEQGMP